MSEWVHSTVGAVTVYQRAGGTPPSTVERYYGGDIRFVTIEDITSSGRFLARTDRSLTEEGLRFSAAWLLKDPHILYSMYATVGKPIINRIPCATNQAIIALKPSDAIDAEFLYYQLLFIRPDVYKYTAQTTQSNLNAGAVKKLPISYPKNKREQRKIAAVLASLDTAIETTEALIEKHQQIKAGLTHDLFTRGVLPNGQLRPPWEQAPELYRQTPLGWLPSDWGPSNCGRAFTIDSGITLGPHRWPRKHAHPYIRVANLHRDEIRMDDVATLEALPSDADRVLKRFDLLVVEGHANTAEIGRCAMVDGNAEGLLFQNHLFRLRALETQAAFALLWLNSHHVQRYWGRACATSSGLNTINRTMLKAAPFYVPSDAEQSRITDAVSSSRRQIRAQSTKLEKLRAQKLGLMQDLLTGKVSVKRACTEVPA